MVLLFNFIWSSN